MPELLKIPQGVAELDLMTDYSLDLESYFDSDSEVSSRFNALDSLVIGLTDDGTSLETANQIVAEHTDRERQDSLENLYRYWLIIRTTNKQHPEVQVPRSLLDFTSELAHRLGELPVEVALMEQAPLIDDDENISPVSYASVLTNSVVRETKIVRDEFAEAREVLQGNYKDAQFKLEHGRSSMHVGEYRRLRRLASDPDRLRKAIEDGEFVTMVGISAAELTQDNQRLVKYSCRPEDIKYSITMGLFYSDEGLAAAKAAYDNLTIVKFGSKPEQMFDHIIEGLFETNEGLQAAIYCQDQQRLASHESNPEQLLEDLQLGRFFTVEGRIAAEYYQDVHRIKRARSNRTSVIDDIRNSRYFTAQGLSQARQLLSQL